LAIKLSEKESFIKSFTLLFIIIELFLIFIFYNYYQLQKEYLNDKLFLEMKNYSFFFDDSKFDIETIAKVDDNQLYELYFDNNNLYIITPIFDNKKNSLAILYPLSSYNTLLDDVIKELIFQFIFLSFISAIISIIFAIYSLSPLRDSLRVLEEFIKDIIHDLNTPITSILINLQMMKKDEEVESIMDSTNTISMLHKNLISYLNDMEFTKEKFSIKEIIYQQIKLFNSLYYYLEWKIDIDDKIIYSNPNAISRIIYNLISNSCKYNISNGFIEIKMKDNIFSISNSSYGIKNPSKVFDRFYKESKRGLGIGLHIVDKLSKELNIKVDLVLNNQIVIVRLIF
jgi:two-component system OmpR family sensor kinase